jgi:hypothetical protein
MTRSGVLGTLLNARCTNGSTTIRTAITKAIILPPYQSQPLSSARNLLAL